MTARKAKTESQAAPAALPGDKASKLRSGARKAGPGAVANLLHKLEIPRSDWFDVLIWLMHEQGGEIGHQWQIVTTFALEHEQGLPVDDAVWLLESLGEQLAFRGKDSVFHGASLLLPGWDVALDRLVIRSFLGQVERLRPVRVHDTYRLGLLYARAHLGDEISAQERAEVLAALAGTYVTVRGQLTARVPVNGELLEYDDISFDNDDVDEDWAQVVRPFGTAEAWEAAIGAAAAACERIESRWERADVFVDRVLRHVEACRPEDLAVVIAFGHVDESACGGERGEVAARCLGPLDAEAKSAALQAVREVAGATEREIPREVSDALMPGGAALVQEIEQLAAASGMARDVRIYVPVRGERSLNGVAEIAPGAYTPDVPELDGQVMDPLVTLDLAEVPELGERLGSEAVVFFLSRLGNNSADEPGSGEVVVKPVSLEQARDFSEGTPFRLAPIDVPGAAFDAEPPPDLDELAAKIKALPARVLGPPVFVRAKGRTGGFVMQLDERFVEASFGGGVMYLYDDDGFWQS